MRQRMAGLRTNTLVAIGAATFVIFAALIPGETSPTRVAAQVVSGIGFLGAGIIFREGLNVTGLNTAATLWCSAAVGLLAGAGQPVHAALATAFVIFANLGMRPLVRIINRQPIGQTEVDIAYKVRVVCRSPMRPTSARCCCKRQAPASSACGAWRASTSKPPIGLRSRLI